jgi:hypothetical protein
VKAVEVAIDGSAEDFVLALEVEIDGAIGDVSPVGNIGDARTEEPFFGKDGNRRIQDALVFVVTFIG